MKAFWETGDHGLLIIGALCIVIGLGQFAFAVIGMVLIALWLLAFALTLRYPA